MVENLEFQIYKKNEFVPASFIKRFAAAFGEYLFILSIPSVLFILSYCLGLFNVGILFSLFVILFKASGIFFIIMAFIIPVLFYDGFEESRFKATPFKMLLGLQVFNVDETEADSSKIIRRAIFKTIIIIVIGILFLNFLNMPDYSGLPFLIPIFIIVIYNIAGIEGWLPFKLKGQALHDQLAGTIVLQKTFFKNKISIFSIILIPFILFLLTFNIFYMWSRPWLNIVTIQGCFNGAWMYRLGLEEYSVYNRNIFLNIQSHIYYLRDMVEKYGECTGGIYPKNLQELSISPYWKNYNNPYCHYLGISGIGSAFMDYKEYQKNKLHDKHRGLILYEPIGTPPKGYHIYGCDIKGEMVYYLLVKNKYTYILDLKKDSLLYQLFPFLVFDISYLI